jgi:hypothetical protein
MLACTQTLLLRAVFMLDEGTMAACSLQHICGISLTLYAARLCNGGQTWPGPRSYDCRVSATSAHAVRGGMQRRPNSGAFAPCAESWRRGRDHPNPGDRSAAGIVAEVGG